jgi:hypothetical protein
MLGFLIATVVFLFSFGMTISYLSYRLNNNKRFVSRILDLISYSITVLGFIGSFIAVANYEKREEGVRATVAIALKSHETKGAIVSKIREACADVRQETAKGNLAYTAQCEKLIAYADGVLVADDYLPAQLPSLALPNVDDEILNKVWMSTILLVNDYNSEVARIRADAIKSMFGTRDVLELRSIVLAIFAFAFSMGMGLARRIYDAKNDLRST